MTPIRITTTTAIALAFAKPVMAQDVPPLSDDDATRIDGVWSADRMSASATAATAAGSDAYPSYGQGDDGYTNTLSDGRDAVRSSAAHDASRIDTGI